TEQSRAGQHRLPERDEIVLVAARAVQQKQCRCVRARLRGNEAMNESQVRAHAAVSSFVFSGLSPASISARRPSRNGGSDSFSPSVSSGSSVAKPGPSVAISKRMPFGSRKYRLLK